MSYACAWLVSGYRVAFVGWARAYPSPSLCEVSIVSELVLIVELLIYDEALAYGRPRPFASE